MDRLRKDQEYIHHRKSLVPAYSAVILACVLLLVSAAPSSALMLRRSMNELVADSELIAVGSVKSIQNEVMDGHARTRITLVTEKRSDLGPVPDSIDLVVPGGRMGDVIQWVSDTPSFQVGERALVMLRRDGSPDWTVTGQYQGKFHVAKDDRIGGSAETLDSLISQIEQVRSGKATAVLPAPQQEAPGELESIHAAAVACCGYFYSSSDGLPIRWPSSCPSIPYKVFANCTDVDDELAAIQRAADTWNSVECSCARLVYDGSAPVCSDECFEPNTICWISMGASGPIGVTLYCYYASPPHTMITAVIWLNSDYAWSSTCEPGKMDIQTVVLHEMGHMLAMNDQYSPTCAEYVMYGYGNYGVCKHDPCLDEECLKGLYNSGTPCGGCGAGASCTVTGPPSPTNRTPIVFNITFSQSVTGLTTDEIIVTNGENASLTGSGSAYSLRVDPIIFGEVTCQVPAGAAENDRGNPNRESNIASVVYDGLSPSVTINQAADQADPTYCLPIRFTVVFSEPVVDFSPTSITFGGTAGGTKIVELTGGPTVYRVSVQGLTSSGTVTAAMASGKVHDAAGNGNRASQSSDNTVTLATMNIDDAKKLGDVSSVGFFSKQVTAVFPDRFYVQAEDRLSGVCVQLPGHSLEVGMKVDVCGAMRTNAEGERYVEATGAAPSGTAPQLIQPLGLNTRAIGGANWRYNAATGAGQKGIKDAVGLNNIGLLVRTWGRVTYAGQGYFYLSDGADLSDGSGHAGVRVDTPGLIVPMVGSGVRVTGISSCFKTGSDLRRLIRVRNQADILQEGGIISGKVVSLSNQTTNHVVESDHPYKNKTNYTWTVTGPPGTQKIRVHFTQIELEADFDYLYVKDANGVIQQTFDSYPAVYNVWSAWVPGSSLKLNLVTDESVYRYGFKVDKYEVQIGTPTSGVTLTLSPTNRKLKTGSDGKYTYTCLPAGTYTVTPSLTGKTFTPTKRTVTVADGQTLSGVDFVRN
jgi:hypothetical protein